MVLGAIFLLAVGLRVLALQYFDVRDWYEYDSGGYLVINGEHGDDREYEGRAWNLLTGKNFWALPNGDGSAPPGYPFTIALLYSITGRNFLVPLVANAFFGGLVSLAVYWLARGILPVGTSLLAAAGVAVDPFLIFWSTRIMTESIAVLLAVLCMLALIAVRQQQHLKWAFASGLLCGAAILVRGNLIVLPIAFAAWTLLTRPLQFARLTLTTLLCTGVVVASVTMVGVASRPTETESQWERVDNLVRSQRYQEVALDRAAREKGGSLTDEEKRVVREQAAAHIQAHPWWVVVAQMWWFNFFTFWQLTPSIGSRAISAIYFGTTLGLILFSLVGAVSLLRTRATRDRALFWILVIAGFSLLHTILLAQPRYRIILEPLLWILAAAGATSLFAGKPRRAVERAA
jgi:4-amino-4-deoxy-L-arabinose transferase-like glycosyltransferase